MKSFGKEHRLLREETGTCPGHSTVEIYREEQCFPLVLHQQYKSIIEAEGGILPLKALLYHSAKCSELSQRSKRRPQLGKLMWSLKEILFLQGTKLFPTHTDTFKCFLFYYCSLSYPILFYLLCLYIIRKNKEGESCLSSFSPSLTHTHTHTHTHTLI